VEKYHKITRSDLRKSILGWIADVFLANRQKLVLVWLDENAVNKNQFEVEMRIAGHVIRVRFQEKSWQETERSDTAEFRQNPNRMPGMITRNSKQIVIHRGGDQPLFSGLPNNIWWEEYPSELACSLQNFLKEEITGQKLNI
jgi:hypothetical protein